MGLSEVLTQVKNDVRVLADQGVAPRVAHDVSVQAGSIDLLHGGKTSPRSEVMIAMCRRCITGDGDKLDSRCDASGDERVDVASLQVQTSQLAVNVAHNECSYEAHRVDPCVRKVQNFELL